MKKINFKKIKKNIKGRINDLKVKRRKTKDKDTIVEKAQKKIENAHYEIRKNVLKYDDVVNEQRLIIFEQRMDIIKAHDVSEEINYLREEKNRELLDRYIPEKSHIDNWDINGLQKEIERI